MIRLARLATMVVGVRDLACRFAAWHVARRSSKIRPRRTSRSCRLCSYRVAEDSRPPARSGRRRRIQLTPSFRVRSRAPRRLDQADAHQRSSRDCCFRCRDFNLRVCRRWAERHLAQCRAEFLGWSPAHSCLQLPPRGLGNDPYGRWPLVVIPVAQRRRGSVDDVLGAKVCVPLPRHLGRGGSSRASICRSAAVEHNSHCSDVSPRTRCLV
jgi:hypothetical protein